MWNHADPSLSLLTTQAIALSQLPLSFGPIQSCQPGITASRLTWPPNPLPREQVPSTYFHSRSQRLPTWESLFNQSSNQPKCSAFSLTFSLLRKTENVSTAEILPHCITPWSRASQGMVLFHLLEWNKDVFIHHQIVLHDGHCLGGVYPISGFFPNSNLMPPPLRGEADSHFTILCSKLLCGVMCNPAGWGAGVARRINYYLQNHTDWWFAP